MTANLLAFPHSLCKLDVRRHFEPQCRTEAMQGTQGFKRLTSKIDAVGIFGEFWNLNNGF